MGRGRGLSSSKARVATKPQSKGAKSRVSTKRLPKLPRVANAEKASPKSSIKRDRRG
jgi:hypothetical protein